MTFFLAKVRRVVKIVECAELTIEADTLDEAQAAVPDIAESSDLSWNEDDVSESQQVGSIEVVSVEAIATGAEEV